MKANNIAVHFDWSELAFGSKKALREMHASFVMAPRELSAERFRQLVKTYLPAGNLLVGFAKEKYIDGFAGQPQFRSLQLADIETIINQVNRAGLAHKIYTLSYFQRDSAFILEKLHFKKVLLINGSWQQVFHSLPAYYVLAAQKTDYAMLSPFAGEREAQAYEAKIMPPEVTPRGSFSDLEMLHLAQEIAKRSFDYAFQTGATLGRKEAKKYRFIAQSYNRVVPYQTFAMHHGSLRETHFSPMNDLNYYDTIHAEINLLVQAQKRKLDLHGTTLFINLQPCPSCARMLCETDIAEIVYRQDHSDGFATTLLEQAGKKVRRLVQ